jgi:hypothetical protein
MTPNEIEEIQARRVMYAAQAYAQGTARPCDVQAATVAILVMALEMATPDLSDDARSSFFNKGECDV